MRWDQLFADLSAQFAEMADADSMAELPDRQRDAALHVTMVQRCAGALGRPVRVRTASGRIHAGPLREVGPDWVLLAVSGGDTVIALAAVTAIEGLATGTGGPLTAVARRFGLARVLSGLARDRSPVVVAVAGAWATASSGTIEFSGTIDRVGADFVELAQHAAWEPRRAPSVRSVLLVPFTAIESVRSRPAL